MREFSDYNAVEKAIQYYFSEPSLLRIAMTHSSYANENKTDSNENLEFFGDSILNMIVSEYLYNNFNATEGEMSIARSKIVSEQPLAEAIDRLDIIKYLMCGVGESKCINKPQSMRADLFEAIVAAIYLDSGRLFDAEKFIMENLRPTIEKVMGISKPEAYLRFKDFQTARPEEKKRLFGKKPQREQVIKESDILAKKDEALRLKQEKKASKLQKKQTKTSGVIFNYITPTDTAQASQSSKPEKKIKKSTITSEKPTTASSSPANPTKSQKIKTIDYKTELQNVTVKQNKQIKYVVQNIGGPQHKPTFEVAVLIDGKKQGAGVALRKKDAEQLAAKNALEKGAF